MNLRRLLALVMAASVSPNPVAARHAVLGMVLEAKRVHLNSVAVTRGATVYDSDSFSTEAGGMLSLRSGAAKIELFEESELLVRSRANGAPGTEAELSKGTLTFSTTRGYTVETLTLGVRICPAGDAPAVAQVSVIDPKELRIKARRGSLLFSYRGETETIAEGKTYRVILDPPNSSPTENGPIHSPKGFKIVVIGEVAAIIALGIYELRELESPDRP